MRKLEKMLEQTLKKIAEMDNNLKEKLIKADWEEEMQYLRNQAARQNFIHLANTHFNEHAWGSLRDE